MLARMRRALALVLVGAVVAAGATVARGQGELAALTEATVVEREGAVEVWVRLSRPVKHLAELIDSPHRLVLDFEETAYRWSKTPLAVSQDPVRELRGSQFRKGMARLVIELKRKTAYSIERDREGLRVIFPREAAAGPPPAPPARVAAPPPPPPRPVPTTPTVYGIVMLDDEAHAYIFTPSLKQVRRYRVGDAVGDAVIETIGEKHVVLRTPTGRVELRVDEVKPDAPTGPRPR
jgi:hypothetical protein